ncbi:MAG: copper oxidase [Actinobacteria bacterium]|nr:MAG: copper oxidase [Actinomycetota bacterium]
MSDTSSGSTVQKSESFLAKSIIGLMFVTVSIAALVLGVVAVVAINNNNGGSSTSSSSSSTAVATIVQVRMTEFAVTMTPATVPPGEVTFQVVNAGTLEHNFAIPTLDKRTIMLKSGETAELVVSGLEVGEVAIICEVAGHEASGMKATLTVAEGSSSKATSDTMPMAPMTWQQMDKIMEDVALSFPAKTEGVGNQELEYIMSADGYKEFVMTAKIVKWEVEVGKFVDAWTYNGMVPGPVIHVNSGDKVRIVLKNELPESTSMHLHGVRVPNAMDGVDPYTQKPIDPGATFSYEFVADGPAVGMYHSHHNAQVQIPNGMAGALIIDDWKAIAMKAAKGKTGDADGKAEQEVVMVLNDAGTIGLSLNGKSFPATAPYSLKVGETMVVHYVNEGFMVHPMHLHQPTGLVVARDGNVLDSPYFADTISVAPGERWTVVYTAQDVGVWAWHCHILTHAETPQGMRYMVTALIVG